VFIAVDDTVYGVFILADEMKANASQTIQRLKSNTLDRYAYGGQTRNS
jgi:cation transport ATPase